MYLLEATIVVEENHDYNLQLQHLCTKTCYKNEHELIC